MRSPALSSSPPATLNQGKNSRQRQTPVFRPERLLRLHPLRVDRDAGHRAHLNALRLVKIAYALGAFVRVDLVNLRPKGDRLVRALGLAHIAVDAFVSDHQSHDATPH